MVVREFMSLDLVDHLISDVIAVTEYLMSVMDLSAWGKSSNTSIEKQHGSSGAGSNQRDKPRNPMEKGIHRTVC